jgi:hypothetical protein
VTLQAVNVALPPRASVAYIPGVGDNVAPMLAQLGLPVTVLGAADLAAGDLSRFTAIVVGPRAYETSEALVTHNARLLDWARAGGTLVVQFGTYEYLRPGILPLAVTLDRPVRRVTIEEAPVTPIAAASRVLTTPNRIGPDDWNGWVQERATYVPSDLGRPPSGRPSSRTTRGSPRAAARCSSRPRPRRLRVRRARPVPAAAGRQPGRRRACS